MKKKNLLWSLLIVTLLYAFPAKAQTKTDSLYVSQLQKDYDKLSEAYKNLDSSQVRLIKSYEKIGSIVTTLISRVNEKDKIKIQKLSDESTALFYESKKFNSQSVNLYVDANLSYMKHYLEYSLKK